MNGKNGYTLDGVAFKFNSSVNAYQLTADKIDGYIAAGPFP